MLSDPAPNRAEPLVAQTRDRLDERCLCPAMMHPEFFALLQNRCCLHRLQLDMIATYCKLELTSRMQAELVPHLLWQNQTPRLIDREDFLHDITNGMSQ